MIGVRNEFETIPAFEVIAGSYIGGVSNREFTVDILKAIDTVCSDIVSDQHWRDLAECSDEDDYIANGDCIHDAVELFNDSVVTMPEFCHLDIRDNEAIVLPSLDLAEMDDDIVKLDEYPEKYAGVGFVLVVNDHGNVTCQRWNGREYVTIWDMV